MITIVINGQNYDYPQVGDTEWGDAATTAMQALATTTLQPVKDLNDPTAVNNFTLYNDINFGNTNGLRVLFVESNSNNPALSGVFRLCNGELIAWRNEDNDGDNTISFDSDGDLIVNGTKVTLHGQIVNADIAAAAGIEESKLALDHSTQSLYDNIENHKSDTANPHLTNLVNLVDTTIVTPSDNDTLLYDGNDSKWKNKPNSVANISDITVTSVTDGDVLVYDSNDSDWKNSDVVSSHVSNTSNPHSVTKSQILTGDLIVNADVDASAAIVESKLSLDYSTSSLNTAITSHTGNTSNPHSTSVSNLTDTTITGVASGDVLSYDGSKWINQPSTSSSLSGLSDTDINTPSNGDILVYDSVSTKWENSDSLTTHIADTNNPHSTSVSNLDDATISSVADGDVLVYDSNDSKWKNSDSLSSHIGDSNNPHSTTVDNLDDTTITTVSDKDTLVYDGNSSKWINQENSLDNLSNSDIDSNTLTENDVLVFNDQTSKWENSQIMVNHIGNTGNPHLTTVAKLTDASITTPANKDLLQYDYANSQWINSNDVWATIEVNDIAYVGSTPQGHTIDGSNNVTMLSTDNRHQVITATDGYNIILPSTGVKTGERFIFEFTGGSDTTAFSTPFIFKKSNGDAYQYAHTGCWIYVFTALEDNPIHNWTVSYQLKSFIIKNGYWDTDFSAAQDTWVSNESSSLFTIPAGIYEAHFNYGFSGGVLPPDGAMPWLAGVKISNGTLATGLNSGRLARAIPATMQKMGISGGNISIGGETIYWQECSPQCVSRLITQNTQTASYCLYYRVRNSGTTATITFTGRTEFRLVSPITTSLT